MVNKNTKKIGIEPLSNRVLVKPYKKSDLEDKKKNFGIILPEKNDEKSERGEVVAVGPGEVLDGKRIPVSVKVGDIVIFSKYGFEDIEYNSEEYYLIKEDNILAIIK
jgi:chaperonin GroES